MTETASQISLSTAPPAAPRPVTRNASRRSWMELRVRVWWMMAAALIIIAAYLVSSQFARSRMDRWLIRNGMQVHAEVRAADGNTVRGKLYEPLLNMSFGFRFVLPGEGVNAQVSDTDRTSLHARENPAMATVDDAYQDQFIVVTSGQHQGAARKITSYTASSRQFILDEPLEHLKETDTFTIRPDITLHSVTSRLKDQRESVGPGMMLPLFVDPDHPERWTDRRETTTLQDALVGVLLAPAVLAMLVVAFVKRQRTLRVWREGSAQRGIVVGTGHSALAPLSHVVQYTLGERGPVRSVLVPSRLGKPANGQEIWLISPPHRPKQAVVSALYT